MSDKAPHTAVVPGAAGIARQTDAGRSQQREALMAQAKFYRSKRDVMRAHDCEREAEALK